MDTPLFPRDTNPPQSKGAFAAGVSSLVLGLVVLWGWHTHNLALLRFNEHWVAMAYNTAVGFVLGGSGLMLLSTKAWRFAALPGGLLFLLFGFTLVEHVFDANFGIDEWAMKAYVRSGIVHNGRMAINTALCGTLTGAYLIGNALPFVAGSRAARRRSGVSALCGAAVVGLAIVGLTAYLADAASAYLWGKLARMAVHTVLGFVVLGFGLIARAWHEEKAFLSSRAAPRWLPLLVAVGTASASVCLWQVVSVEQNAHADALRKLAAANTQAIPPVSLQALARDRQFIPIAVLVSGLTLGAALSFAVYFAQTARFHAALVEQVNHALQDEITQREKAEADRQTALDALQTANEALEIRVQSRTADLETANVSLRGEMATRHKAEADNARLLQEAAQTALHQKAFLRDVLSSVTEGHLRLCETPNDLPPPLCPAESGRLELLSTTLRHLRADVRRAAERCGFPAERTADLITAVGEASMNAVVHGGTGGVCEAEVRAEAATVQVWITDHGTGIAWDSLHRATLERGYTTASSLGHGFWLMLKTCDRVYLLTGPGGTTVVLEQDGQPSGPSWLDSQC